MFLAYCVNNTSSLFDLSWPEPRLSFGSAVQYDLWWKYLMRNWKVEKAANLECFFLFDCATDSLVTECWALARYILHLLAFNFLEAATRASLLLDLFEELLSCLIIVIFTCCSIITYFFLSVPGLPSTRGEDLQMKCLLELYGLKVTRLSRRLSIDYFAVLSSWWLLIWYGFLLASLCRY